MGNNKNLYKNIINSVGTPTYIYYLSTLQKNIRNLKDAINRSSINNPIYVFPTYFTNSNPHLFSYLKNEGFGVTVQSREEYHHLESFHLNDMHMMVSPTALSDSDLEFFLTKQSDILSINVSTFEEIEFCSKVTDHIGVRLDLSPLQNHRTGFKISEISKLLELCKDRNISIKTIHSYIGTDSDLSVLFQHADKMFELKEKYFNDVNKINLGGGFHFEYEAEKNKHFPWDEYFKELHDSLKKHKIKPSVAVCLEPGRDIFADIGELLVSINRLVKRDNFIQVFTDGSFVHMPSASHKKRIHKINFLNHEFDEITDKDCFCQISGNTTLSSDYLIPEIIQCPSKLKREDYIILNDVGAYCASQHMEFLNKRPIVEILVLDDRTFQIISQRGDYLDKIRNVTPKINLDLLKYGGRKEIISSDIIYFVNTN